MKSQTFRPIHPGCIVQTEKTGAAAPVFLLRSVVPLRLVVQHGSGGGVDDVVILHAAGLELHLIHGPAVFVVPFHLKLLHLAFGQARVLQGRGLGGLGADIGAAGAAAKVLLLIVQVTS